MTSPPETALAILTPETARALLRECVTVVSPGESLVIRVPATWTPEQAEAYQEYASARASFPVLVVAGEELAIASPEPQSFMKDVRVDEIYSVMADVRTGVRLTHLPTGVAVKASTLENGIRMLGRELVQRAAITFNDVRAAMGLPEGVPEPRPQAETITDADADAVLSARIARLLPDLLDREILEILRRRATELARRARQQ